MTRERDNGADFTSAESDLQIQDDGFLASESWSRPGSASARSEPVRPAFVLAGNPFVSNAADAKRNFTSTLRDDNA